MGRVMLRLEAAFVKVGAAPYFYTVLVVKDKQGKGREEQLFHDVKHP